MNFKKIMSIALLFIVAIATLVITSANRTVRAYSVKANISRADDAPTKVVIDMNEYQFTVEGQTAGTPITLKAGTLYDLTVKNTGTQAHEIWFGKDAQMVEDEGRLDGYKTNLLANVPVSIINGEPDTLTGSAIEVTGLTEIEEGPGQSYTIEFTLPDSAKGTWELGCFQPMPKAIAAATDTATDAATPAADVTKVPDVVHYMVGMKADLIVN